jgi:chromosome segregation ATPase
MTAENLQALEDPQRKIMKLLNSLFLEQQNLHERIEKVEKITEKLVFWEKIEKLEREKVDLLAEIESLKEKGESKTQELESEVTALRKEVKELENLLKISPKDKTSHMVEIPMGKKDHFSIREEHAKARDNV